MDDEQWTVHNARLRVQKVQRGTERGTQGYRGCREVQEGYRRGPLEVPKGYRGVQEGYRRGTEGVPKEYVRGT